MSRSFPVNQTSGNFTAKLTNMTKLASDNDLLLAEHLPVQEITERIIHFHYPLLISRLNHIEEYIASQNKTEAASWKDILIKLRQELNSMLAKEQMLLYPFLIILQQQNRKSDCSPFKLVKKHYQNLLSSIHHLKSMLRSDQTISQQQTILKQVSELEANIIQLQRIKEKQLFEPFRDCNQNCKITRDE